MVFALYDFTAVEADDLNLRMVCSLPNFFLFSIYLKLLYTSILMPGYYYILSRGFIFISFGFRLFHFRLKCVYKIFVIVQPTYLRLRFPHIGLLAVMFLADHPIGHAYGMQPR